MSRFVAAPFLGLCLLLSQGGAGCGATPGASPPSPTSASTNGAGPALTGRVPEPRDSVGITDPTGLMSDPVEYRAQPVSAAAGRTYFMKTGVGDPYAAGIAYPVFLALQKRYPRKLGRDWNEFNGKFGTFADPKLAKDGTSLPIGFHLTTDPNTGVKFLMMNCQVCHTGRLRLPGGDRLVSGLGNKRLRIHSYGRALLDIAADDTLSAERTVVSASKIARARSLRWPQHFAGTIVANTFKELRRRSKAVRKQVHQLGAELPGRVATVSGFTMAINVRYHSKLPLPKVTGWVKIPDVAVWRYRDTNSYDGMVVGSPVTLIAEADFAFGVRPRWYNSHRHIPTSIYLFMKKFRRKLPFPGKVDLGRARAGYALFNRSCAKCHGTYAPPGTPHDKQFVIYKERLISEHEVDTDAARLNAVTPAFIKAANEPLATKGLTHARITRSYVPRPLVNVWVRGLYGHNGQWPSLAVLATPPNKRPRTFIVDTNAPYDLKNVGSGWRPYKKGQALKAGQYIYDGTKPGFLVKGHEFLSRLPAAEKRAVMEYLKTI